MQAFVRIVDAVDGIDVLLGDATAGSGESELQRHRRHLNGAEALDFARDRADGVFSRAENQNLILCALQAKLTSPSVMARVPELIRAFQGSIQTDLSPQTMSQLACLAGQLPAESIALYSFPEDLFSQARVYDPVFKKEVFIWDVDFRVLRDYVTEFLAGSWPVSSAQGSALPASDDQGQPGKEETFCP
jgi:anionic cell wall polymer biosynthesis LytR-Cps2A-Psr (LCP) family protein